MDKLTSEQRAQIKEIVSNEGWELMKQYIFAWAGSCEDIILNSEDDVEKMSIEAMRLKFGTIALSGFFNRMEEIAGLDKKDNS